MNLPMPSAPDLEPVLSRLIHEGDGIGQGSVEQLVPELLRAIRSHLGMEVAFVSQFRAGRRVYRYVDAGPEVHWIRVGDSDPLESTYCQRVVDGRLPGLMRDAQAVAAAREIDMTTQMRVGSHLSVPIRLLDGHVYGTFCAFSRHADPSLNPRDLAVMRLFADITAGLVEKDLELDREAAAMRQRITAALDGGLSMVYQPIVRLGSGTIVGFEALARFAALPLRSPDLWFGEAELVGLRDALELCALKGALAVLGRLPADVYVACNLSPETLVEGRFGALLGGMPLDRVVLEVTEHAAVRDYVELASVLAPWRARGLRLAVDDAGAGYSSFRHIVMLMPDLIKLDMSLTRAIDTDIARRALAAALMRYAQETGSELIAEGVETRAELDALRALGVDKVQGNLLGEPVGADGAARLCARGYLTDG